MMTRTLMVAVSILVFAGTALAATPAEPTLKEIMQGLQAGLLQITAGLVTDDFDQVAEGASGITEHAPISAAQLKLIGAELGSEIAGFKQLDKQVHDLSLSISAAAKQHDRGRAIADYQQMVTGCLACHAAFKDRLAAVLGKTSR